MRREHIHFVTGRLAEHTVRSSVSEASAVVGFDYTIDVLGISVAALMTPQWIARRIKSAAAATRVMIPGYCRGDVAAIEAAVGVPVVRGPRDIRQLTDFLGHQGSSDASYGAYTIEIIAEINHASGRSIDELVAQAERLRRDGADVIDVGCDPGEQWPGIGDAVRALRERGHRVSVDTLDPKLIAAAAGGGAELVLSVNSTNRLAAADWGCEVVAIPDAPDRLDTLAETMAYLDRRNVSYRVDPVLEPIGFGFAASLMRYWTVRRRWPDVPMMMGVGNLTELTEVDSAGVNVVLLAFCEELGIHSVLTTEVINWARTAVRECDVARRLVHHAVDNRMLPKHVDPRLVMLRDERVYVNSAEEVARLARDVRDPNYRILLGGNDVRDGEDRDTASGAEDNGGTIHVINRDGHHRGRNPFALFDEMLASASRPIDAKHAFYLGYEMAKALTALSLGKNYRQDEALDWGLLTRPEHDDHHTWRQPSAGRDDDEN